MTNDSFQIDRLPVRTWNQLKMNETRLDLTAPTASCGPEAVSLPAGLSWKSGGTMDPVWSQIPTGGGPDVDRWLGDGVSTALLETDGSGSQSPAAILCPYGSRADGADRICLHAGKGAVLPVILLLQSDAGASGTAAVQIRIRAEEGAQVRLYVAELLGEDVSCVCDIGGTCADDARIELVKLELGSGRLYAGVQTELAGDGSSFQADIGCRVKGGHTLDMNYVARHHGKKTTSQMNVASILEEGSSKLFRGTIDFPKGCQGAKGMEQENVLLLGRHQRNQTIPLILCQEEDVEGDHGASIGRLDDQVLFYLASRGISRQAAENMIARARLDAVCALIPSEEVRDRIRRFLDPDIDTEVDGHEGL